MHSLKSERGTHTTEAQTSGYINNHKCDDTADNGNAKCSGTSKEALVQFQRVKKCLVEEFTVKLDIER